MREKQVLFGIAAIASGILASACCIGPVLLVGLGIGGAAFATAFAPYRPYLLGLTAVFLGGAFYLAYRPQKVTACAPGAACSVPSSRRRMRALLWVATIVAVGAAVFPYVAGAGAGKDDHATAKAVQTVVLDIEGMTCEACATHIRKSLEEVPGVVAAPVDYARREAIVKIAGSAMSNATLLDAVKKAGYAASVRSTGATAAGATP